MFNIEEKKEQTHVLCFVQINEQNWFNYFIFTDRIIWKALQTLVMNDNKKWNEFLRNKSVGGCSEWMRETKVSGRSLATHAVSKIELGTLFQ